MEELFTLPQIVSARPATGARPRRRAVREPDRQHRRARAGGGRARQAVHQHLALHQVRRRQPVLHDGQRPRAWTSTGSARALAHDYPRAADMPGAGFAAGPCLFKDTMQLAAFTDNSFVLGHSAMLVNEGLPLYLVSRLEAQYDLANLRVGILGMAFKGESDDIRSSLSYKLKRILEFRASEVLCTDPYVSVDADLVPLEDVLGQRRPAGHRRAAHASTATWRPTSRWPMSGTCSARGSARMSLGRSRSSSRPTTRARPSSRCSTGSSTPSSPSARCWSWSTSPEDTTVPVVAGLRRARAAAARPGQHLRPRPGERDPLRHRPGHATRSSWSPWPTAATTRARSTSWPGWSTAAWWWRRRPGTSAGGQQVGGPMFKGMLSRERRAVPAAPSAGSAPGTPPTASRPTPPSSSARSASTAAAASRSAWS